jgi:hypothetical protein
MTDELFDGGMGHSQGAVDSHSPNGTLLDQPIRRGSSKGTLLACLPDSVQQLGHHSPSDLFADVRRRANDDEGTTRL